MDMCKEENCQLYNSATVTGAEVTVPMTQKPRSFRGFGLPLPLNLKTSISSSELNNTIGSLDKPHRNHLRTSLTDFMSDAPLSTTQAPALTSASVSATGTSNNMEVTRFAPLNRKETRRFQDEQRRRNNHQSKMRYKRLVFKNGECNISHMNIKKRKRRFLSDIFTTLVDIKWRYTLLLFVLAFIISWIFFGIVWWLICFAHEDFTEKAVLSRLSSDPNLKWKSCVDNVEDFTTALLFSIETQHTIGYGYRVMTSNCPEGVLMVMIQSCFGVIIQALMTGLVFAKLSRPKKRAATLMFSKNALICKRDGFMTLLFRVGDMRKSQIIEAHIRGILIKKRITYELEVLPLEQYDVDFGFAEGRDRLFLVWPVIIEHKIDEKSPLWNISYQDLVNEQFEIIVILEGVVESTGSTTQARSSYLPGEIKWGHRFEKLVTYQKENGEYQIDYEKFHCTREIPNFPKCSAFHLKQHQTRNDFGSANVKHSSYVEDEEGSSNKSVVSGPPTSTSWGLYQP